MEVLNDTDGALNLMFASTGNQWSKIKRCDMGPIGFEAQMHHQGRSVEVYFCQQNNAVECMTQHDKAVIAMWPVKFVF